MNIRPATLADLPQLEQLYAQARRFMAQKGNPTQWGSTYPDSALLTQDIQTGSLYVCCQQGQLLAAFVFAPGPDPTYRTIQKGSWLPEPMPYWVIHRVASSGQVKGTGAYCLEWCFAQHPCLRIDTHRDNLPMQRLLARCGFVQRGEITLPDGSQRLVYQRMGSPAE